MEQTPVIVERGRFTPVENIKPHHFLDDVWIALLGNENPYQLARKHIEAIEKGKQAREASGKLSHAGVVYLDEIVPSDQEDRSRRILALGNYFKKLGELPDEDYVSLDIAFDGLCDPHSYHCMATQVQTTLAPHDNVLSEKRSRQIILDGLMAMGAQIGSDFVERESVHLLDNYHGNSLDDRSHITVDRVEFPALIVQVGVLRQLAAQMQHGV